MSENLAQNPQKRSCIAKTLARVSPLTAVTALLCGQSKNESLENECPLGDLNLIPAEVVQVTFSHLSIRDLSTLSMASKAMGKAIEDYCITPKNGFKNIVPRQFFNGSFIDIRKPSNPNDELQRYSLFCDFGLLLKRTTCLYPTRQRLHIVFEFILKIYGSLPSASDVEEFGTNIRFPLKCIGYLLHTVVAGWDESECQYVFSSLEDLFGMKSIVKKCLQGNTGRFKNEEYFIRSYYRLICLDFCPTLGDKAFWLSLVLQQHLIEDRHWTESRAKMLAMIYGPLIGQNPKETPTIAWWDLTDSFFIEGGLKEIGYAIHLLHGHLNKQNGWTTDVIVAIINKVIAVPNRWLLENIATFLFHCGEEVVKLFVKDHFSTGQLPEVASYIVYLTLISQKFQRNVKWIIDVIDTCFASASCQNMKRSLIMEIPIAFNEALSEIEHLVDVDDARDVTELHDMINAQIALMKALFQKAYPCCNESCVDVALSNEE